MSNIHICTTNSLRAGIDLPPMECPYCNHETLYPNWVSSTCDTCGHDTERYTCNTMMHIRLRMGFNRKQFSKLIGYSPKTIKQYEFCDSSKVYWDKFKSFVLNHYAKN